MTQHLPEPDITEMTKPYWDAIANGELRFQTCNACGHRQLPARHECTNCLSPDLGWTTAKGTGTLVSWIEYHRAYNPVVKDMIPYNVAIVALDEGPRLISNIATEDPEALTLHQKVQFRPAERFGHTITSFVPV